jgi:integrase
MGRRRKGEPPTYRLHKQSSQAIVSLPDGIGGYRDILLGKYGTAESRVEYARVIAEWEASGRRLPQQTDRGLPSLTINELILAYWKHAEQHYRHPDGTPTAEIHCLRAALRPLKQLYGHAPVAEFGPLALKTVRQKMIEAVDPKTGLPWCRRSINLHVSRIRALFKWGVENQLVSPTILQGLQAVRGLQQGRSPARETDPVRPVHAAFVEATLPFTNQVVRSMIEVQQLTGMRPGEVIIMRGIDLDMTAPVWLYRPGSEQTLGRHKTAHHGHQRIVAIGPRAQEIIRPFLKTDLYAYLFCPRDALENPKWRERRKPGFRYRIGSYRQAIRRACIRADVPVWKPHQLRHTKATEIRREAGLDAARAVLGHRSPQITETYAEIDVNKAAEIMARLG